MTTFVEWDALAKIVIFGVLIGAGLPALYAVGVRSLDSAARNPARARALTAGAYTCFGLIVAAILYALYFIAIGGH